MGYEWQLLGNYGNGWDLLTTADTRREISQNERDYRLNEPGVPLKIKRVRERVS
jgi:hypothetical protein